MTDTTTADAASWYTKKAVWGAALAIAAPLAAQFFHINVTDVDMNAFADKAAAIGSAVGGLIVIIHHYIHR